VTWLSEIVVPLLNSLFVLLFLRVACAGSHMTVENTDNLREMLRNVFLFGSKFLRTLMLGLVFLFTTVLVSFSRIACGMFRRGFTFTFP